MGANKIGFLCGVALVTGALPMAALAANSSPAKEPMSVLLSQENQIQAQIRQTHKKLLLVSLQLREVTDRMKFNQQRLDHFAAQKIQVKQEMACPTAIHKQQQQLMDSHEQLAAAERAVTADESKLQIQLKSLSDRIAKSVRETPKEASFDGLELDKLALLSWPVLTTKEVSSDYGWRNFNGDIEFHSGIDVAANEGDPIYASADGTVLYAGPAEGFGHWIVIRHKQGLLTIYGHMYRTGVKVKPGQTVHKGDIIGLVGADGRASGPHLHFAVARGMSDGLPNTLDPWFFLAK